MTVRACAKCGRPQPCPTHARAESLRRAEKSRVHGLTSRAWRRTRRKVLARDLGGCRLRLAGCTGEATSVHRLPEFGPFHDENLDAYVSACAHCHGIVDAPRARR